MSKKGARNYRPKLHFTPASGWTNDPNGLVYENGNYHLFYQHYPYDTKWGPMHWGHAKSRDLLNWEHLPIALAPDELGHIFSGSAVYDKYNTSGLGTPDKPPIVAMFTHSGETQQQSIACSSDGINFTKYINNPVIKNPGIKDFRDPKLFHNPIKNCWSVVIAAGDHVDFYASPDLINWEKTGEFGPEGNLCPGIWECPDIFPLTAPDGQVVWVLIVSMTLPEEMGGPKTQYFLGAFNGDTFICTLPFGHVEWIDSGFDNYAAVSFSGDELKDKIIMGWGMNWRYAADTPTNEYCGCMTLPRKCSLIDTPQGLRLSSKPIDSLNNMLCSRELVKEEKELVSEVYGLHIESDGEFTVVLSNENNEKFLFGVNSDNQIFLDRSESGDKSFSDIFNSEVFSKVLKQRLINGRIVMDVIFDVSIVEIFCDEGTFACAQVVYPKRPYNKLRMCGDANLVYYDIYNKTL